MQPPFLLSCNTTIDRAGRGADGRQGFPLTSTRAKAGRAGRGQRIEMRGVQHKHRGGGFHLFATGRAHFTRKLLHLYMAACQNTV